MKKKTPCILSIKMDYRKKVSWSSMALSLATLNPLTPDPQPWNVFNDNFTSVQGEAVRSLSSDDSHHNVYDDDHLLAGRWVEQGVPGQLLLPLVQEQFDGVSLVWFERSTDKTFLATASPASPLEHLLDSIWSGVSSHLADFPAVFFHICNFNICHEICTTDKYKYQRMKIRVS